jgi:hypothetical protein
MLVIKSEAAFNKKATGLTTFTCEDGWMLKEAIEKAVTTGEAQSLTAVSAGTSETGELIAKFLITWSFKAKLRAK